LLFAFALTLRELALFLWLDNSCGSAARVVHAQPKACIAPAVLLLRPQYPKRKPSAGLVEERHPAPGGEEFAISSKHGEEHCCRGDTGLPGSGQAKTGRLLKRNIHLGKAPRRGCIYGGHNTFT
jgi:hypothetical protein